MKTVNAGSNGMADVVPVRSGGVRDWQNWAPYAAVAWSLIYAASGIYWLVGGRGFPFTPETISSEMGPLLGRFGQVAAWIVVILAGIPAAVLGTAMLRGLRGRLLRPLFIAAGVLLAGSLLLLMTVAVLAAAFRYIPFVRPRPRLAAALAGAVPAALALHLANEVIGLVVSRSALVPLYGAGGTLVVILLWAQYSASIVLFGAHLCRAWDESGADTASPRAEPGC